MKKPLLSHDGLLHDIDAARHDQDAFHLWWLGQSGFLVQWQGRHLLLDPYLSDSLTHKYADTDQPHVRMTELVVDPLRLDFIDLVTSSHNHTDHLDGETLSALMSVNPELTVVVPSANQQFAAERLGVDPQRLTVIDDGVPLSVAGFRLNGVPAAHEQLERDEEGRCRFLGYVVEFADWTIYHSGDTIRYDGMADLLAQWPIDVAILPINGREDQRGVPGNLWGREAAQLAYDMAARLVIPCHYDMFEFNTATPEEFVSEAQRLGQPFAVLQCGQRWSSRQLPGSS